MMLPGKAFHYLGGALREIESVLNGVEEEKYDRAAAGAEKSYRELNMAVISLLEARSSSGSSAGSPRERMQGMLQQQISIDQQLQGMLSKGASGQSMEERAQMARLAAEQRRLEDVMKQIADESEGKGELLGRLDDLAEEMEEVARRLEEGELDDELLDREQRVLSRMLESTRSIHRKDYKRERVSTSAGDIEPMEPGTAEKDAGRRELLIEMIRRAMQEKGPVEYEELIRLYFRALSKHVREDLKQ
jgi:hypothetical protein